MLIIHRTFVQPHGHAGIAIDIVLFRAATEPGEPLIARRHGQLDAHSGQRRQAPVTHHRVLRAHVARAIHRVDDLVGEPAAGPLGLHSVHRADLDHLGRDPVPLKRLQAPGHPVQPRLQPARQHLAGQFWRELEAVIVRRGPPHTQPGAVSQQRCVAPRPLCHQTRRLIKADPACSAVNDQTRALLRDLDLVHGGPPQ